MFSQERRYAEANDAKHAEELRDFERQLACQSLVQPTVECGL